VKRYNGLMQCGGVIMKNKKNNAFTLIELLVVVSIIALLVGILIPTLSKARAAGRQTKCKANLRSIGQAIRTYMDEYNGFYPPMKLMIDPPELVHSRPMMSVVLENYVGKQKDVFICPDDHFIVETPPPGFSTWHDWQGSSYSPVQYLSSNSGGNWVVGREDRFLDEIRGLLEALMGRKVDIEDMTKVALVHDYEAFHDGQQMALFADFHVDRLGSK